MRLRSLNTTRASQLDEHGIRLANAFDRHERDYADRHGDDPPSVFELTQEPAGIKRRRV